MAGFFVNRTTEAICVVGPVDESYAHLSVIWPGRSGYSMPRAEYDAKFGAIWRPATTEDMARLTPQGYVPPANVPEDWGP